MSGLALRRLTAALAALTWPAIRLFETITHPWWGSALSDAVAPLTAMVLLALVITSPAAHRRHFEGGHAKGPAWLNNLLLAQVAKLRLEVSGLDTRVELCELREDRAEARIGRCEKRVDRGEKRDKYMLRAMSKTNAEAGYSTPDPDGTGPQEPPNVVPLRRDALGRLCALVVPLTAALGFHPGAAVMDRLPVGFHDVQFLRGKHIVAFWLDGGRGLATVQNRAG